VLRGWRKVAQGAAKKVASRGIRKEDVVIFFEGVPQIMKTRLVISDYRACGFGFAYVV
jgi:hypothetical protein